jgi:2-dehydropantoate 2-reductase
MWPGTGNAAALCRRTRTGAEARRVGPDLANAIEALSGYRAVSEADGLRRRARAEGTAVLGAAGIGYASEQDSAAASGGRVQIVPVNGTERTGGSSWQSLTRGTGSIEADFLNGEIVLLGREHGVPTPVNEVLQRLANQAARQRRAPRSISPAEIMALAALPT